VFSHVSGLPSVLLRIRFCAVAYTTSVEKPRGSRHLEDLDTEDNIQMVVKGIGWQYAYCIHLAQKIDK